MRGTSDGSVPGGDCRRPSKSSSATGRGTGFDKPSLRSMIMPGRSMPSGQTGSQAPHSEQASNGAARSAAVAPHCRALARPSGVKRGSRVARHIGQTRKHKLQPVQAV